LPPPGRSRQATPPTLPREPPPNHPPRSPVGSRRAEHWPIEPTTAAGRLDPTHPPGKRAIRSLTVAVPSTGDHSSILNDATATRTWLIRRDGRTQTCAHTRDASAERTCGHPNKAGSRGHPNVAAATRTGAARPVYGFTVFARGTHLPHYAARRQPTTRTCVESPDPSAASLRGLTRGVGAGWVSFRVGVWLSFGATGSSRRHQPREPHSRQTAARDVDSHAVAQRRSSNPDQRSSTTPPPRSFQTDSSDSPGVTPATRDASPTRDAHRLAYPPRAHQSAPNGHRLPSAHPAPPPGGGCRGERHRSP
jgi:hypothetical protein